MKVILITAIVVAIIFTSGLLLGIRLSQKPDAVTNGMLQEKIEFESAGFNKRLDSMDSKLDILLNVATNSAVRDLRR